MMVDARRDGVVTCDHRESSIEVRILPAVSKINDGIIRRQNSSFKLHVRESERWKIGFANSKQAMFVKSMTRSASMDAMILWRLSTISATRSYDQTPPKFRCLCKNKIRSDGRGPPEWQSVSPPKQRRASCHDADDRRYSQRWRRDTDRAIDAHTFHHGANQLSRRRTRRKADGEDTVARC